MLGCISIGAIRYDILDIGEVPGTNSIQKSISLLGGSPEMSWNKFSNSYTTSICENGDLHTSAFKGSETTSNENVIRGFALEVKQRTFGYLKGN